MTSDRTDATRRSQSGAENGTGDPIAVLVRSYGHRPPYDAVDWTAMAQRILAGAADELERLRVAGDRWGTGIATIGIGGRQAHGLPAGRSAREWWEVTAGWARPAAAAAIAAIAVTAALVLGQPNSSLGVAGVDTVATTGSIASVSATGGEADLLGTPTTADYGAGAITRDSLFAALVDAR